MEYRTKVELKFDPDEEEAPGKPVRTFKLIRIERHEYRRKNGVWYEDGSKHRREIIADCITRRMVVNLIADGADWLSYIQEECWRVRSTAES